MPWRWRSAPVPRGDTPPLATAPLEQRNDARTRWWQHADMTDSAPSILPYGSWPSPITAESLVRGAAAVGEIRADGDDVWWSEQRPDEGGRTVLVRRSSGGGCHDLFPPFDPSGERRNWNARTLVLEYGGGAWAVRDGTVVFADLADQRLHRVDPAEGGEALPVPITPAPSTERGLRYSEVSWLDAFPGWLLCVRESHEPDAVAGHGEAVDEVVALPIDGSAVEDPSRVVVLAAGSDFVHSPVARGAQVAWLRWDHPRMPWDGTELAIATLLADPSGAPERLVDLRVVAGGAKESVVQPGFLADGTLAFCTDRTGWWNPWREVREGGLEPMIAGGGVDLEIGGPLWVGGLRWWAELAPGRLLVCARSSGTDSLAVLEPDGELRKLDTPFTEVSQVVAAGDGHDALVVAGTPTSELAPMIVDVLDDDEWPIAGIEQLRRTHDGRPDRSWISVPEAIEFESADGRRAHGLWYPPTNPEVRAPHGDRPPLVVMIHGGPTSAARHVLSWAKQFWTSRGFGVVDVDHGGSTGYGRPFRELLDGATDLGRHVSLSYELSSAAVATNFEFRVTVTTSPSPMIWCSPLGRISASWKSS